MSKLRPLAIILTAVLTATLLAAAAAPLAAQGDYTKFVEAFDKARSYGDEPGMDRAVKQYTAYAIAHHAAVATTWGQKQESGQREILDALDAAWRRVYATETLQHVEDYYSRLDAARHKVLIQADAQMRRVFNSYAVAEAEKDRGGFETVRDAAMQLGRRFAEIGEALKAAQMWSLVATVSSHVPDRTIGDKRDTVAALERFLELRRQWDHTGDQQFKLNAAFLKTARQEVEEAVTAQEKRAEAGFGADVKGVEAYVKPGALETVAELEFAAMRGTQMRYWVRGGPFPALWSNIYLGAVDSAEKVPFFKRTDLYLVRAGAMDFAVRVGSTERTQEIEAPNRLVVSSFHLDDQRQVPYAMWFYTASTQETVLGMNQNLAPSTETAPIYYLSAASWTGKLHGEEITLFDDNGNGELFEKDPMEYGMSLRACGQGPGVETPVPALDSMRIGRRDLRPWAPYSEIDGTWYHLASRDEGDGKVRIAARELHPEFFATGSIELEWTGGRRIAPELLVVIGRGDFAGCAYDIASGDPVEVPIGVYTLGFGRIVVGKGSRATTAMIMPGELAEITVEKGKTTTVSLGAPFHIDFDRGGDDEQVVIDSTTLRVVGKSGEHYVRLNGEVLEPAVLAAASSDGKRARPIGEFVRIDGGDMLNRLTSKSPYDLLGIEMAFFPVVKGDADGEPVLRAQLPMRGALVGMEQRKHKLFGKLDPVFK